MNPSTERKPLVDDLADVLARLVGDEHPDVLRVMVRYRESKRGPCYACGKEGTLVVARTDHNCSACGAIQIPKQGT